MEDKLQIFLDTMTFWTQKEKEEYLKLLKLEPIKGIRINNKKISNQDFLAIFNNLKEHPIIKNGFIYLKDEYQFGKIPYFYTGIYYIQEPSAMMPVDYLDVLSSDIVLDLCASPGGKSTQILEKLTDGFLVANEIDYSRNQILIQNLVKTGNINYLVTNESSANIAKAFSNFFDKIIVDSFCSLQGNFRKNSKAIEDFSIAKVKSLAKSQKELILDAYNCLKPGGVLVYSTCTFSLEENEEIVNYLMSIKNAELLQLSTHGIFQTGINQPESIRIYPFDFPSEGHFIAKIKKLEQEECAKTSYLQSNLKVDDKKYIDDFLSKIINIRLNYRYYKINNDVYLIENNVPKTKLKITHLGVKIGYFNNKNFIPSDNLAHFLPLNSFKQVINLDDSDKQIFKYLHGDVLSTNLSNGYVLIAYCGYGIGFGKIVNNTVKNFFPKYLRIN